ncbi:DUF2785 domain-containing protein [Alicyclobacillus tolerans]|uniref:DUF2785 domain-containing protein n=1 Tax=Alicyclobacillus tolerans TaxID=90970 RepID=UPI001F4781E2|nr:DUF2785 domain-containing protein [Alicyclobacillus tolerans]MCF8568550.1 DUF2785 domain-containing protein [Alicyclobacillus tolerans]
MNLDTLATNKKFLRDIIRNDFQISESVNATELCLKLMPNLHSIDAEFRDELSYGVLANLLERESFTVQEWSEILAVSVSDDYLFWGIGQYDTDTVFARAFAILIVAVIVEFDAVRGLLRPEQVHQTTETVLDYVRRERDYRGYVDGKGWAHSVAHMSYALDSCAHHPSTTKEERMAILDSIFELATLPAPLSYMEADHLSRVVFRMIKDEQVTAEELHPWIERFSLELDRTGETVLRNGNASDLLKSLYFLLTWEQPNHPLINIISAQIKKMNIFYRYGISFDS